MEMLTQRWRMGRDITSRIVLSLVILPSIFFLSTITSVSGSEMSDQEFLTIECMFVLPEGEPKWCSLAVRPSQSDPTSVLERGAIALGLGEVELSLSEEGVDRYSVGGVPGKTYTWNENECIWEPLSDLTPLSEGECLGWIEDSISSDQVSSSPSSREPWTQFRGDQFGRGISHSSYQFEPDLLWSVDLASGDIDTTPVVHGGKVFVVAQGEPGSSSRLFALDGLNGEVIWSTDLGTKGFQLSTPAITNGLVLVGTTSGILHAFKEGDGATQWTYSFPSSDNGITGSPTIVRDRVIVPSGDGTLTVLDLKGNELWSSDLGSPSYFSSPSSDGERVYVGTDNAGILCFELGSGELQWRKPTEGQVRSTPMLHDGMVYFTTIEKENGIPVDGSLIASDKNGTDIWSEDIGPSITSPAIIDGKVVVGNHQGGILAFSLHGEPLWSTRLNGPVHASPSTIKDHIFITTNTNSNGEHSTLYLLSSDGAVLWSEELAPHDWGLASPTIADHCVFTASDSGFVSCWQFGVDLDIVSTSVTPEVDRPFQLCARPVHLTSKGIEYHWDLGDGTFAEGEDVAHSFNTQGVHTVTLSWKGELGYGVSTQNLLVTDEGDESASLQDDALINIEKDDSQEENDDVEALTKIEEDRVEDSRSTSLTNIIILVITIMVPSLLLLYLYLSARPKDGKEDSEPQRMVLPTPHRSKAFAIILCIPLLILAAFMTTGMLENPFVGSNGSHGDPSETTVTLKIDFGKSAPPSNEVDDDRTRTAPQIENEMGYTVEGSQWSYTIPHEEGMTVLELLESGLGVGGHDIETTSYSFGILIESIAGVRNGEGGHYWQYYIDGVWVQVAANVQEVFPGDLIEWRFM